MKLRRAIRVLAALGICFAISLSAHSALAEGQAALIQAASKPKVTLGVTLVEYHKAKLSWNAVPSDGYRVYRSTSKYGFYTAIADVNVTTYTDQTLFLGKTYYYKVCPFTLQSGKPVQGVYSNIRSVSPKWPTVTLRCALSGTHSARLSWTKLPLADGYEVLKSVKSGGPYSLVADITGISFLDKALSADTAYYYRVRPYDLVDGSKYYGNASAYRTVKAKWQAMTLSARAVNYSSVVLTWNALRDIDGYEVLRSTKSTGPYESIGFAKDSAYTDSGLSSSTYYYKVRPYVQANGQKAYGKCSGIQSVKPAWPTILPKAEQIGSGTHVKWNAIDGVKGYEVQRGNTFDGPFQTIAETDATEYADSGQSTGSVSYYRVRAYVAKDGTRVFSPYSMAVYMRLFEKPRPLSGLVIGIDPGHQAHADYAKEPEAPGSSVYKAKVSSGTRGVVSKVYEYEVNLLVGEKLKSVLESMGASVVMTRETNDINISNAQRAQMFNRYKTDYAIRLHCNGSSNPSVTGAYVLIPTKNPYLPECKKAAQLLIAAVAKATGAKTYPYVQRGDQAGFNYCERMIVNIEMGYMTNASEDRQLVDAGYQQKMAEGIANGILSYFGVQ